MITHVLKDINCRPYQGLIKFRKKTDEGTISLSEVNLSTGGQIVRELDAGWCVFEVDDGFIALVHESSLKPFIKFAGKTPSLHGWG